MTRYLRSLIAIGFGSLVYIILSFGARFDRVCIADRDQRGSERETEGLSASVVGHTHFGSDL